MAYDSGTALMLGIALVAVILIVLCCMAAGKTEGFIRSPFRSRCSMSRTPVDFVWANTKHKAWQDNPHYKADPGDYSQPLDVAPVDLHRESRRQQAGILFEQYGPNYQGDTLHPEPIYNNDSKARYSLTDVGDVEFDRGLRKMDRSYGIPWEDIPFRENSPFQQIYGGNKFLHLAQRPGE